jgi:hypothetical protein
LAAISAQKKAKTTETQILTLLQSGSDTSSITAAGIAGAAAAGKPATAVNSDDPHAKLMTQAAITRTCQSVVCCLCLSV